MTAGSGGLVEVWGDTVNVAHLGWSIIVGSVISLSGYFIASRLLTAVVASHEMARAYAMLVGLAGCLISGVVCARLFAPKREVVEEGADPFWREEALEQLVAETGALGSVADLPPAAVQESKELGLPHIALRKMISGAIIRVRAADRAHGAPHAGSRRTAVE